MDNQKNCTTCGAPIPVTTKFCPFCGASQAAAAPQGTMMPNMPQGAMPPNALQEGPAWEPAPQENVPKKSIRVGYIVVLAVAILLLSGGAMLMFFSSIGSGLGFLLATVLMIFGAVMLMIASLLSRNKKERQY